MQKQPEFHICFVSPNLYALFNPLIRAPYGGAEVQLYHLARYLGRDPNLEVSVLTQDFGQEEVEYYSGVLVYRIRKPSGFFPGWMRRNLDWEYSCKKVNAQVYLMCGAGGLTREVSEFCEKHHRAFVFQVNHQRDCDGTFIRSNPDEGESFRWSLHHARGVICQTGEQKELLQRTERIPAHVISNCLELEPSSETMRQEVLWVGQAAEWKQPELFFRLALTLPDVPFTMITAPRDPGYFETLVAKTRTIPNLGFQNSVPYSELNTFFAKARLVVNTSRFEGFPFTFTQALAQGIPLISLNVDPDGILEKHQMGICAHGSELRLAQAVQDLMTYGRQWMRLRENALRYAKENLDIHLKVQDYRKLFLHCLGRDATK